MKNIEIMPSTYKTYLQKEQYRQANLFNDRARLLTSGNNPLNYWQWLAQQYDFSAAQNILEVGCGPGQFWNYAQSLVEPHHSILLTDFSKGMLSQAKSLVQQFPNSEQFDFRLDDVERLTLGNNSFDQILAHLVLHHLDNPNTALSEIKRVLKPSGQACITAFPDNMLLKLFALINKHLKGNIYKNHGTLIPDTQFEKYLTNYFQLQAYGSLHHFVVRDDTVPHKHFDGHFPVRNEWLRIF